MKRVISLILAFVMILAAVPLANLSAENENRMVMTAVAASEKYTTTAALNMRKGAGENYAKIVTVPKGATVISNGKVSGKYQYVSYTQSGKTYNGWVLKAYLKSATETKKYQTTAALNMRKGAGENYAKIITVPKGATVTSNGKVSGKYQYVSYTKSGKTYNGWVLKAYLKAAAVTMKYKAIAALSMRKGASENYAKIATVPDGATVTSSGKVSGKYQYVSYTKSGKTYTGWVLKAYLMYIDAVYKTTSALNMRKGAGENYAKIATVPNGATVESNGKVSGKYQYVSYTKGAKTYNGWVLKAYLKKISSSSGYNDAAKAAYKKTLNNFRNGYGLPNYNGTYLSDIYEYIFLDDCYYAIVDIDSDNKLEMIIKYSTYATTECLVFSYSSEKGKVICIDICSPEVIYPNGFWPWFDSHNQGGSYIWPYDCIINGKEYYVEAYHKGGYIQQANTILPGGPLYSIGNEYGIEQYWEYSDYDFDGDGVVYLITSNSGTIACDKAYYVKWVNQATGGTKPMKISYSKIKFKFYVPDYD